MCTQVFNIRHAHVMHINWHRAKTCSERMACQPCIQVGWLGRLLTSLRYLSCSLLCSLLKAPNSSQGSSYGSVMSKAMADYAHTYVHTYKWAHEEGGGAAQWERRTEIASSIHAYTEGIVSIFTMHHSLQIQPTYSALAHLYAHSQDSYPMN